MISDRQCYHIAIINNYRECNNIVNIIIISVMLSIRLWCEDYLGGETDIAEIAGSNGSSVPGLMVPFNPNTLAVS